MAKRATTQTISSGSEQRKNIPVVTVESFYNAHAEKLHLKLAIQHFVVGQPYDAHAAATANLD